MAANLMPIAHILLFRHLALTDFHTPIATGMNLTALPLVTTISEVAIIRHINRVWHLSGNGIELVTDFPQPDSPTTPTVFPMGTKKLTESTLFTVPASV